MEDIKTIPIEKLLGDLIASVKDATVCENALANHVTEYSGGKSVIERRDTNLLIVEKIRSEIIRRCKETPFCLDESIRMTLSEGCEKLENAKTFSYNHLNPNVIKLDGIDVNFTPSDAAVLCEKIKQSFERIEKDKSQKYGAT